MLSFRIVHHIPGRIRIEIPYFKKIPMSKLLEIREKLSKLPVPEGIEFIKPSFLSGSVVIKYRPEKIDIVNYLENVLSCSEIIKDLKIITQENHS